MRVLAIYSQPAFWSMGEGAGAVVFSRTLEALAARGHDVHVSLPCAGPDDPEGVESYHGFQLHRRRPSGRFIPRASLPLPLRLWERVRAWRRYQSWGTRAALEVIREHRPDVLVAYGAFETPVAGRIGRRLDIPNVTRLFGVWLSTRSGLRFYANFPEIAALRTPAHLWIVTNDGSHGDRVARRLSVPMDRFVFLRNGLDFDRFQPGPPSGEVRRRLEIGPDAPLVMAVARLAHEKKLDRALRALPGLLRRHPEAVLAFVGDGPEREPLQRAARALGVERSVRFPGAIAYGELPEWYRSADILLSLLDRTNAANPAFEAMACGRTLVALDSGSTREVVHHDQDGWVVSHAELPVLGDALAALLDDPARRDRLGRAAAESIRKILPSPAERLNLEIDLLERVARREAIPGHVTVAGAATADERADAGEPPHGADAREETAGARGNETDVRVEGADPGDRNAVEERRKTNGGGSPSP